MPTGQPVTNYPNGITNAPLGSVMQSYIAADPSAVHSYFDDFNTFAAASWTITKTQSGATQAIINGDGGILSLVNTTASADLNAIQLAFTNFAFVAGTQLWFKCRFNVTSALNTQAVIGLQVIDTTPLAVTDGVFFQTNAASNNLNLVVEKTSTATTTLVGTLADSTYVTAGFHYDGGSNIFIYLNGNRVATSVTTNLPTVGLTVSMAVSNGTAAGQTMNIDYFEASSERNQP